MRGSGATAALHLTRGTSWAIDCDRVIIVQGSERRSVVLRGYDAIIWSWVTQSPPPDRLAEAVAALLNADRDMAATHLDELLNRWSDLGWLEPDAPQRHEVGRG